MAKLLRPTESAAPNIPPTVLILWIFGGLSFALIVFLFTPFTHNLDDIKVTFQYALAPIVWAFFGVAVWCGFIKRIHPILMVWLIGFLLVTTLATLLGKFPWWHWHEWGFQLTIMAPFFVIAGTASNARRFRNMTLFYFLVACGTAIFGLFHYLGGIGVLLRMLYPDGQPTSSHDPVYTLLFTLRSNGDMLSTILNRDFYAAYVVMIFPVGLALAIDYEDVRARFFFLIMFFLQGLCVLLAFSKDSYIAVAIMVIVFLVLFAIERDWKAVPRRTLLIWGIASAVLFATVLVVLRERLFDNFGLHSMVSVKNREIIWGGAWGIYYDPARPFGDMLKHLFIGAGPGDYYLEFPIYRNPNYHLYEISNVTLSAHNQYLGLLAEEGIIGFVCFMTFLGLLLWYLLREIWRKPKHPLNVYQIALFSAIVGVSIQNITSPGCRWTVCGFNYWYMLGLAVAAVQLTATPAETRRMDRFWEFPPAMKRYLAGGLLVFGIIFMVVSVPFGLIRFNACVNNNEGLIYLNDFSQRCDMLTDPLERYSKYAEDRAFIAETKRLGMRTIQKFEDALRWKPCFITSSYKLAHVYSRLASKDRKRRFILCDSKEQALEWFKKAQATYDELRYYAPDYSEIHFNYGILGLFFYEETSSPDQLHSALIEFERAAEMSNKLAVQQQYREVLTRAGGFVGTSSTKQTQGVALLEGTIKRLYGRMERDPRIEAQISQLRTAIAGGRIADAGGIEREIFDAFDIKVAEHIYQTVQVEYKGIHNEGRQGDMILMGALQDVAQYYVIGEKRYAEAIPVLDALLEFNPENTSFINRLTAASLGAGTPERGLKVLARLIAQNPLNWRARDAAREILEQCARAAAQSKQDAKWFYERALEQSQALEDILDPKKGLVRPDDQTFSKPLTFGEAAWHAGVAAEKLERFTVAFEQYRRGVTVEPTGRYANDCQQGMTRLAPRLGKTASPAGAGAPGTPAAPVGALAPGGGGPAMSSVAPLVTRATPAASGAPVAPAPPKKP
jgi:O-antigen ligase/tetratricopeptide (TPR) repeat protein